MELPKTGVSFDCDKGNGSGRSLGYVRLRALRFDPFDAKVGARWNTKGGSSDLPYGNDPANVFLCPLQGGSITSDPVIPRSFGIDPDLYKAVYSKVESRDSWMTFPMVLRPKSRGSVMLRSSDPGTPPRIIPNYLSHPDDVGAVVRGIRLAQHLSQTRPMQRFASTLHDVPLPGCTRYPFDSDEYWACAARHLTFNIYHQCGTCKMGPPSDPEAVVDPRLRVRGVRNLRVVDASVIPVIPAAHTNAPTVMIAEKAADIIKEDWGSCPPGDPLCGAHRHANRV